MVRNRYNTILIVVLVSLFMFVSFPVVHFNDGDRPNLAASPLTFNEFGLVSDNLISSKNILKRGESFDILFRNLGLNQKLRKKILLEGNNFLKGFTSGDIYYTYYNELNPEELQYIVLEKDPINYVVIELENPLLVYEGKKEFAVQTKLIEGEIKSSFSRSLKRKDINSEIIESLRKLCQSHIDFYQMRKGDNFKFIIEEKYIGDSLAGDSEIIAVYFNHSGKTFYAIRYTASGSPEYYDLSGRNVRSVFLKAPVEFTSITSPYSDNRFHPILKINRPHLGIDYAAPTGTPIHSVADGIISESGYSRGNGRYIRVIHDNVYSTQYLHMSRFAKGIIPGKKVRQGDVIGYVGSTGLATGPHLCFRFWKNGMQINPLEEELTANIKLKGKKLKHFFEVRDSILTQLNTL